jgi:hypothetical protein
MYAIRNPHTKKEFKMQSLNGAVWDHLTPEGPYEELTNDGVVTVEGPHYPQPHRWYAQVTLTNGVITDIK